MFYMLRSPAVDMKLPADERMAYRAALRLNNWKGIKTEFKTRAEAEAALPSVQAKMYTRVEVVEAEWAF
jgi:uncharacterized membrane protein